VAASLANTETLAQVGGKKITRTLLNEWMTVDIGSHYYEIAKHREPSRLVSEPPNYPRCVAGLNALASIQGKARVRKNTVKLTGTCEQLYQAIKAETLAFLVGSYWILNFDATHNINVTDAEVRRSLERVRQMKYRGPGQFAESLRLRDRTLSQELFLARVDLLQKKLKQALQSKDARYPALSKEVSESTYSAICRAEDVVAHCREFDGHGYSGRSASALLREIAQ